MLINLYTYTRRADILSNISNIDTLRLHIYVNQYALNDNLEFNNQNINNINGDQNNFNDTIILPELRLTRQNAQIISDAQYIIRDPFQNENYTDF